MKTLKQLIEDATKTDKLEDGTASDLGIAPTGHIEPDKEDKEEIE